MNADMEIQNHILDSIVRPSMHFRGQVFLAFRLCGYIGLALAPLPALCLVTSRDLSLLVMAGIMSVAVLTFFGLVIATKIITGEERVINYHHQIGVMVVAAVLLRLLGQPVLPYLDVTILGIGMFLVCGRIGCLMAGCCHGRPFG
jgi:hypothetical protein